MAVKRIYLLFTDTGTVFTKTIKLYTRKQYNHASISFDEELTQLYSFGRKNPRNPFIGGFVKENINEGLFKKAICAVYCLPVEEADYYRMQQYISRIEAQKEYYRYNLIGLFAIILNMQLKRENAFFCSEFVASVLKQSDTIDFNTPLSLVAPHDLQTLKNLELVYQGKLKDYQKKAVNEHHLEMIEAQADMISI
ncbi:hypothetical protein JYK21_09010 [Ralstonia pickettii]|nr:hypothetical protein [Ralstonia pickettii]